MFSTKNVNLLIIDTASINEIKNVGQTPSISTTEPSISSGASISINGFHLSPILIHQLNEASVRADARDAGLSHNGLKQEANKSLNQITGMLYYYNQKKYDAETPNTTDPDLLSRAKQATDFINGKDSNPFKGLSYTQLSLITYDNSGTFTMNERRAAWSEAYDQEQAWRKTIVTQARQEYNNTGKQTHFLQALLDNYHSLPTIEQVQYPVGYEAELQTRINQGSSDFSRESLFNFPSLLEMMIATMEGKLANDVDLVE